MKSADTQQTVSSLLKASIGLVFVLALAGIVGNSSPLWAQAQPSSQQASPQAWQQIPIPKLPEFHPAEPKRIEFPNGMVVFLQ